MYSQIPRIRTWTSSGDHSSPSYTGPNDTVLEDCNLFQIWTKESNSICFWMLSFELMPLMVPRPVFICPCFPTSMELQIYLDPKSTLFLGWSYDIRKSSPAGDDNRDWWQLKVHVFKFFFFCFPIISFLSENHLRRSSVYILLQSPTSNFLGSQESSGVK